jgi:transcriptional regulator with XRE-family HTH domain
LLFGMANVAGSLIRDARLRSRMSQRDLARLAHTSQAAVQAYESGRRQPSVGRLMEILDAAGFDLRLKLARSGGMTSSLDIRHPIPTPTPVVTVLNSAMGPEEDDRILERLAMSPQARLRAMLAARRFTAKYRGAASRQLHN